VIALKSGEEGGGNERHDRERDVKGMMALSSLCRLILQARFSCTFYTSFYPPAFLIPVFFLSENAKKLQL